MSSSHKEASRVSPGSLHLALGDRRSPVQPFWAVCLILGRLPNLPEPQSTD